MRDCYGNIIKGKFSTTIPFILPVKFIETGNLSYCLNLIIIVFMIVY